jgi:hypothetical protein
MAEITLLSILIPAASGLLGAVIGSATTHLFTRRRERDQKRQEFSLKYLIEAWQNLEEGSRVGTSIERKSQGLEKAIVDIQLFGSPSQIKLAKTFTDEMVSKNSSDTTVLLRDFQIELRKELGLQRSPVQLFFFRLTPIKKSQEGKSEQSQQ